MLFKINEHLVSGQPLRCVLEIRHVPGDKVPSWGSEQDDELVTRLVLEVSPYKNLALTTKLYGFCGR